jgi:LysR family transcriptional activator of dmlA
MLNGINAADFKFFSTLAAAGSLSAAARELELTTAAVSKRLGHMEARLGVVLATRTTRRMGLTPEGEIYLESARKVVQEVEDLERRLGTARSTPTGLLRINATLGFGRVNIAPVISRFVLRYPEIEVKLQLSVNPPLLSDDAYDVCIHFGLPPDSRVIAQPVGKNRRLLCASPAYLKKFGEPVAPTDLSRHNFISIRQGEDPPGVLRFVGKTGSAKNMQIVKVHGNLVTNDGEIAVNWALDGHGIVMRAEWDVGRYLRSGRLVEILTRYATPDADIFAVFPQKHLHTIRVRAFVEFLTKALQNH